MRNILISLISALILVVMALALVPLFVSTDFLKNQVQQFVKTQTGMSLDINGDVNLSVLTGLRLAAENVSLRDANEKQIFSVNRLDFALALTPLLSGKADITGITLNEPVITLNSGGEITTADGSAPSGIEAPTDASQTSSQDNTTASTSEIDLSALQLHRLSVNKATIVKTDDGGHSVTLVSALDLEIRVPDFAGPASLSGQLPFNDKTISFNGQLANATEAINGRTSRLDLDVSSELMKATLQGDVSLKGQPLMVANFATNVGNVTQFVQWLGSGPLPLTVGNAALQGSIVASDKLVQLPSLSVSLDEQTIEAAAKIFLPTDQTRMMVRVALDSPTLNLDEILKPSDTNTSAEASSTPAQDGETSEAVDPDLSVLSSFDATLDSRIGRLTYQGKSIRQFKLLAQIMEGQLTADLKSANLAKGNLQARLDGDLPNLIWNGTLKASQLDIEELAKLAGQEAPATGTISSDLNFAAQGLSSSRILANGNIAGIVNIEGGSVSHPQLQAAIPTRETGTISNINSTVTINGLGAPASIKGSFAWNGETIRIDSSLGMSEILAGVAIPTNLSLTSNPFTLSLAGSFDLAKATLSGSKLSLQSASSRALLSWLGQTVGTGTPDFPISLSTRLDLAAQQTNLNELSLGFGQSRGTGNLSIAMSEKPAVSGKLSFEKLDVTPFMGDGTAQGRSAERASTAGGGADNPAGWDTTPIDLSGLNTINADLTLSTGSLIARDIVTGPVSVIVKLQDGQLTSTLDQLSLYGGQGTGGINVTATSSPAQMAANFTFDGMNMRQFLGDSIDLKTLDGTGMLMLNLTASGTNQADIISHLQGAGKIEIRDGQIKGINIPQMLRSLKSNILEGWASSDAQSTDFTALTASFEIADGKVTNSDLLMLSPLLRLSGAGQIDLPNKTINYKATPKLISKLQGQGGLVDADGLPIPILIQGKLSSPRIYPDIPGILENPQAILKGLEQMGGTGEAASKGIQKLQNNVTKTLQKESEKLGIDLNGLLNQNGSPSQDQGQPAGQDQAPQDDSQKQQNLEQQLFRNITKGLFGN